MTSARLALLVAANDIVLASIPKSRRGPNGIVPGSVEISQQEPRGGDRQRSTPRMRSEKGGGR